MIIRGVGKQGIRDRPPQFPQAHYHTKINQVSGYFQFWVFQCSQKIANWFFRWYVQKVVLHKQKEIQANERKEQKQGMIPTAKYIIIADGSDKDEASFPWQFTILKSDQGDHYDQGDH